MISNVYRYPGSNEPSDIAFRDLVVGSRVRFTRPEVHYDEDDGGVMGSITVEGTVVRVNPRGEVFLSGVSFEGEDLGEYYGRRPSEVSLLEDATFGEWFWEIEVLPAT